MKLSEVAKEDRDRRPGAAAVGAGGALTGVGLLGGGVPGGRANLEAMHRVKGASAPRKAGLLLRAGPEGIFGYRAKAHERFLADKSKDLAARGSGDLPRFDTYARGDLRGKLEPEETIIRHMRRGKLMSRGVLAGGAGVMAGGVYANRRRRVAKASRERRESSAPAVALGAGGTLAGAGYGGARVLEGQARKWSARSKQHFDASTRLIPALGETDMVPSRTNPRVPYAKPRVKWDDVMHNYGERLGDHERKTIEEAGRLRGTAAQDRYFASSFGENAKYIRRFVGRGGLAAAGVGAAGLGAQQLRRRRGVAKAYRPSYFQRSVPTEREMGQSQRLRTEAEHQAARGAAVGLTGASTAALGARWAGHKYAPLVIVGAEKTLQRKGVPKEVTDPAVQRAAKLHRWAAPRRGRLLAAGVGLSGAAAGAGAVARWKRHEVEGISTDLGRASAGDAMARHSQRVMKSAALNALGVEMGTRAAHKWISLPVAARKKIVTRARVGSSVAAGGGVGFYATEREAHRRRMNRELKAGGGLTDTRVVKADRGTNVREYGYLPENIREEVGVGIARTRRNPISALDLFATGRLMAGTQAVSVGHKLSPWQLTGRAHNEATFAGSRAMLYSPAGRGSVF